MAAKKKKPIKKSTPAKAGKKPVKKPTPAPVKSAAPKSASARAMITPLDDRLVVSVEGPSETTAGGIIIPGTVMARPSRGKVLAKGRGRRNKKGQRRPLAVEVGDEVLFAEFAGTKLQLGDEEVLILREDEVLGVAT
jgi:chaperonin GroES